MEIMEFAKKLAEEITATTEYVATAGEFQKNNGRIRVGISAKKPGTNVAPCIYVDEMHEAYENGRIDFAQCVANVIEVASRNQAGSFNENALLEYSNVKSLIRPILRNREMNEELEKSYVSRQYGDLTVFYVICMENFNGYEASIKVTKSLLGAWGIEEKVLYEDAISNLHNEEMKVVPIISMLPPQVRLQLSFEEEFPMLVATNESSSNGARFLLMQDRLNEVAKKLEDDLVIIPSSIHEVIIIGMETYNAGGLATELAEFITQVNSSELEPEDVLANHPYFFIDGELRMTEDGIAIAA